METPITQALYVDVTEIYHHLSDLFKKIFESNKLNFLILCCLLYLIESPNIINNTKPI